jgi:hypothetical protein
MWSAVQPPVFCRDLKAEAARRARFSGLQNKCTLFTSRKRLAYYYYVKY